MGELEGRRPRAADQRPSAERARGLPDLARHHGLRLLADAEVLAEPHMVQALAVLAQRQFQRRAGIVMPDLVGIGDFVPVRAFATLQQEVDRRTFGRAERLDIVAALGMRLQAEARDDLVGCHAALLKWGAAPSSSSTAAWRRS